MFKIPVYRPQIGTEEREYVIDCIDSTWISSRGKYVDQFENEFSSFTSIPHSISVSNGTVALHLALGALDIKPGDEVIVPTFTYIASVNCIKYVGATPVFADSNISDWQLDLEDVEKRITHKTKAIIAVHLYGQACDLNKLRQICNKHKIYLIEDCAEAFGTKFNNQHVGKLADIATFSFFGNKTITTGEGGMVCTSSSALNEKMRRMRSQGVSPTKMYWHDMIGFNFRMTNICAAIGVAQLKRAHKIIEQKRKIAESYFTQLEGYPIHFLKETNGTWNSYWMVTASLESETKRDKLRDFLKDKGIETRPSFYPVHTMPMYLTNEKFKNADVIAYQGINLPSYPDLTADDIKFICNAIKEFFAS